MATLCPDDCFLGIDLLVLRGNIKKGSLPEEEFRKIITRNIPLIIGNKNDQALKQKQMLLDDYIQYIRAGMEDMILKTS